MEPTRLDVEIAPRGAARGTLGWLAVELHAETIRLAHTTGGKPAAWLVLGPTATERRMLLAIYEPFCGEAPVVRCWPFAEDHLTDAPHELFGTPLTPAAQAALAAVAQQAGEALQQWLDAGDQDDSTFELHRE